MRAEAHSHPGHSSSLRDYLRVVRRRKWIILQAVLIVPLAALALSLRQPALYEASSQVLINPQNLGYALSGIADPGASQADRVVETASQLARVPDLARRVLNSANVTGRTPAEFLANSSVTPKTNTYIEELVVRDRDPAVARRLATAYAREFAKYKQRLDTESLQKALNGIQADLRTVTDTNSPEYQSARDNQQKLDTMMALQAANTTPVRLAGPAVKVQPKPARNTVLGLVLGTVLGFGLAFLWEGLDTRVRSAEEIGERLELPLLARLPEPPRKLRKTDRLVMLEDPRGAQAEAFRMLRTNLEFVRLNRDARTIMFTSSVEQEGKSTTVANLAIALARAGQKVALVDLDLRRPFLHRFFDIHDLPGLTQVALGHARLEEALAPITIPEPESRVRAESGSNNDKQNGVAAAGGLLTVLTTGPIPPNAGEFVSGPALERILMDLKARFDVILIDAPPALQVGDAMALSSKVDALIVVARMNVVRRHMLSEMGRILDRSPAEPLGFILTGAQAEEGYGGYGGYSYGGYRAARSKEREPVSS
jgi:polysaccharide biosynthesis transport protein